jgi:hypothetical protein
MRDAYILLAFACSGEICRIRNVHPSVAPAALDSKLILLPSHSLATWDTPPPRSDPVQYSAYLKAFDSFLLGRQVVIPVLTPAEANRRDSRRLKDFKELKQQPDCVVGGVRLLSCEARGSSIGELI